MSHCPPLSDNTGDAKLACYKHCRNAVAPYVAPHRWTPLRPGDFQDCMQNCRECTASRKLYHNCVEYHLASHPTYTALAERVHHHGCPECRQIMHAIEHHYITQCHR
tara:strand:- start:297 stop:617 length:321 start_codon:yes stop_codon:yes gene_type:complete